MLSSGIRIGGFGDLSRHLAGCLPSQVSDSRQVGLNTALSTKFPGVVDAGLGNTL